MSTLVRCLGRLREERERLGDDRAGLEDEVPVLVKLAGSLDALADLGAHVERAVLVLRVGGVLAFDEHHGAAEVAPGADAADPLPGVLVALVGFELGGFTDAQDGETVGPLFAGFGVAGHPGEELVDFFGPLAAVDETLEGFDHNELSLHFGGRVDDLTHVLVVGTESGDRGDGAGINAHCFEGADSRAQRAVGCYVHEGTGMRLVTEEGLTGAPIEEPAEQEARFACVRGAADEMNFVTGKDFVYEMVVRGELARVWGHGSSGLRSRGDVGLVTPVEPNRVLYSGIVTGSLYAVNFYA